MQMVFFDCLDDLIRALFNMIKFFLKYWILNGLGLLLYFGWIVFCLLGQGLVDSKDPRVYIFVNNLAMACI